MALRTPFRAFLVPLLVLAAIPLYAEPPNPSTAPAHNAGTGAHTRAFVAPSGPDAEYLSLTDRYTWRPDGVIVHEHSARLQVSSYLAINRKYGETKVEFDPELEAIEVLANRTVLPSGKVVEAPANAVVEDQPPAAHGNPMWSQLRRKVIVHTALEPGAVIEVSWRIISKTPQPWIEVAEPLAAEAPVRSRLVEIEVRGDVVLHQQLTGVRVGEITHEVQGNRTIWRVATNNIPAMPDEPGAPPRAEWVPTFWASTCPSFEALETAFWDHVGGQHEASGNLQRVARDASNLEADREAKILAVLDAVSSRLTTTPLSPGQVHWRVRPLTETWRSGFATPLELAVISAQALHESGAGIEACPAMLGVSEVPIPAFVAYDRPVVVIRSGATATMYDPVLGGKHAALEPLLRTRRLMVAHGAAACPLPAPQERPAAAANSRRLSVVLAVAADGRLTGSGGVEARLDWARPDELRRDLSKAGDALAATIPGGTASTARGTALASDASGFVADLDGKLPDRNSIGLVTLSLGAVPGGIDRPLPALAKGKRVAPIQLPDGEETVELELTLTPGWSAAALPEKTQIDNDAGSVLVFASVDKNRVTVERRLVLRTLVPATGAADLRALVVAWQSSAGREILLRPPATAPAK